MSNFLKILTLFKNMAQAPYLDELLNENLKSNDLQLSIKHNDDYDSELTDFEEDSSFCLKSSTNNADDNDKNNNNDVFTDKQMDFNNNSNSRSSGINGSAVSNNNDSSKSGQHRSIRLKDLNILLTDPPGQLIRSLHELVKSMNSSSSTVNPNNFHSAFCKRYVLI